MYAAFFEILAPKRFPVAEVTFEGHSRLGLSETKRFNRPISHDFLFMLDA